MTAVFARIPRSRRLAQSVLGRRVRTGMSRAFPGWTQAQRDRAFDQFLSCDFINRAVYRFHNAFPRLAMLVARLFPPHRNRAIDELIASDRPLIVAGAHLGPVFFNLLLVRLLMGDRPVYTLHAERGSNGPSCVAFMRRIGVQPVLDDPMATRTLLTALRTEKRPAIVLAFDHLAVGKRVIPFLASSVPVSDGVAYLADRSGAAVITAIASFERGRMRFVFEGPFEIDTTLPPDERRRALVDGLYRLLEGYVAAAPRQWTEWSYLAPDVV